MICTAQSRLCKFIDIHLLCLQCLLVISSTGALEGATTVRSNRYCRDIFTEHTVLSHFLLRESMDTVLCDMTSLYTVPINFSGLFWPLLA